MKQEKRSHLSRHHRRLDTNNHHNKLLVEKQNTKRASLEHSDALLFKTVQAFANPAKFYQTDDDPSRADDLLDLSFGMPPRSLAALSSIQGSRDTLVGSARDLDVSTLELPKPKRNTKTRPPRSPTFYDKVVDLNKRRSLTSKGFARMSCS